MRASLTDRAVRVLEGTAALALLLLMILVLVDVVGRNALNKPVPWGTEMLEIIVAAMIFLLYPVLALQGGHITVDLIQVRSSLRQVQHVLSACIGSVLFAVITWCLGKQAIRAGGYGEASPILGVPLAGVLGVMSVLARVCAVAFVIAGIRFVRHRAEEEAS